MSRKEPVSIYTSFREKIQHIHGIHITPFDKDGKIDWNLLEQNIEFLLQSRIRVIVTGGNTGEFYSLTQEESQAVAEFVVAKVGGRALVILGIGYDYDTAVRMAQFGEKANVDGLMVHHPINPFLVDKGMSLYYKNIAKNTKLPMLLYIRGNDINMFALQAINECDNIVGVKMAVANLPQFTLCVSEFKQDMVWICGIAEMWAPWFMMAGARGFTSGLVNVAPEMSLEIYESLKAGDMDNAFRVWRRIVPFEQLRSKYKDGNNVSVVKEAMAQLGLSSRYVRAPIVELPEEDKQQVTRILESWGKIG